MNLLHDVGPVLWFRICKKIRISNVLNLKISKITHVKGNHETPYIVKKSTLGLVIQLYVMGDVLTGSLICFLGKIV
jgi:hypothetical protein